MKRRALLPLVTCPDPISDGAAANAAAMAARLDADLHALAVVEDIPPLSNALSRILLNTPELIRQAETMSRKHGKEMLTAVTGQAGLIGVEVTTTTLAAAPALLGDAAATQARCFDFALVEWAANNQTSRMTAEAAILSLGPPRSWFLNARDPTRSIMSQLRGTAAALPPAPSQTLDGGFNGPRESLFSPSSRSGQGLCSR